MTEDQQNESVWEYIKNHPADNVLTPENSDGYNESDVYRAWNAGYQTACKEYQEDAEKWRNFNEEVESLQKKLSLNWEKVEKWNKVQEVLNGYSLEIHYPDGKSITVIEQQK